MILAKEIDGELWVKASDHHRLIKDAQRTWVGLTPEEMYLHCPNWLSQEHCKTWLQQIEAKLKEKNT